MPKEFVDVAWKSSLAGKVRVTGRITHAHPACGNGVAWWLEHRRGDRATVHAEGAIDRGGEAKPAPSVLKIDKGDLLILAVDARNGDHSCDLTELGFTIAETEAPARTWDLAADVADTILAGNPRRQARARTHGASSRARHGRRPRARGTAIPAGSTLDRWCKAAVDPAGRTTPASSRRTGATLLTGRGPPGHRRDSASRQPGVWRQLRPQGTRPVPPG